jgi:hypothetical protein
VCFAARVQWYVAAGVPKGRSQFVDRNGHFNHTPGGFPGVRKGGYSAEIAVVSAREHATDAFYTHVVVVVVVALAVVVAGRGRSVHAVNRVAASLSLLMLCAR